MAIKTRLLTLRQQTQISTQQIAIQAHVSIAEVYTVEIGGFIDPVIAQRVLDAFCRLSGKYYTLDDIRLQNIPKVKPAFSEREWLL